MNGGLVESRSVNHVATQNGKHGCVQNAIGVEKGVVELLRER